MGVCAHKKDHEDADLPSSPLPPKQSAKRHILQELIDLNKARKVPVLSLAHNPLYIKRVQALKAINNSNDDVYQVSTLEDKSFTTPL